MYFHMVFVNSSTGYNTTSEIFDLRKLCVGDLNLTAILFHISVIKDSFDKHSKFYICICCDSVPHEHRIILLFLTCHRSISKIDYA